MVSQHRATSHFSHIIESFLVTPLAEHARYLRVADEIDHRFLSRSSSLRTWVTAAGGLPIGLCIFRSCPACANKFHNRVIRKSLCEIFLPPNEEKRMFLWPLPCATVDGIRILHSISLIYVTNVAVSARKEYSVRPRNNAVICHVISAAVCLWYFTDQSLYVHVANSN